MISSLQSPCDCMDVEAISASSVAQLIKAARAS